MATQGEMMTRFRANGTALGLALAVCLGTLSAHLAVADPIPTDPQGPSNLAETDKNIPEVKQAIDKFGKGDVKGALDLLDTAVKSHPELPPAKVILARICFSANQGPRGRILLEQAAQETPKNPAAVLTMAQIALSENRVFEAGMLYQKALDLANQFEGDAKVKQEMVMGSMAGCASAAEGVGNWDLALKFLQDWLKLDDKSYNARQRMGRAQFEIGYRDKNQEKITEAYKNFQATADQTDQVLPPGVFMGQLYESKEDRAQAQKWMDFALKDPKWGKDTRTIAGVGRWYFDTDRPTEARKLFDEALKAKPDDDNLKKLLGVNLRFLKQYPEAEKLFEEVYGKSPSDAVAINQLALVLIEQDDKSKQDRAVQLAETNARQYPQSPEYQATLGYVYDKLGRAEDAKRRYKAAFEANQNRIFPDLAYFMAIVQNREGRFDAAKALLEPIAKDESQPFAYEEEAKKLLSEVEPKATGTPPAATPVSNPPATTPPTTGATP